jgi:hypothetical protein
MNACPFKSSIADSAAITEFASAKPFVNEPPLRMANPWKRSIPIADLLDSQVRTGLSEGELLGRVGLFLHRILMNIYDQSMLYLPSSQLDQSDLQDFNEFYDPRIVAKGAKLKGTIEYSAFSFLETGRGTEDIHCQEDLESYFDSVIRKMGSAPSEVVGRVLQSRNPVEAMDFFLVQFACDFLAEASQMARAMPGSFGPEQSQLTKIFVDEYGYGIHSKKHSTLFEECLVSVGLSPMPHRYFTLYLSSSLALSNYFHFVTSNKKHWLRYIGALFLAEASIPHFNKQVSEAMRAIYGESIDTRYFDEHVHIDMHHSRMVMELLIKPSIQLFGRKAISEIHAGFEDYLRLQTIADNDLITQIDFMDYLDERAIPKDQIFDEVRTCSDEFSNSPGMRSVPNIIEIDVTVKAKANAILIVAAGLKPRYFESSAVLNLPAGRLYSLEGAEFLSI